MIDPLSAVEVRIKPYGSRDAYHEYTASSKTPFHAPDRNEVWIEAVTGERFVIEVILHPLFQWKKARQVKVWYTVDGRSFTSVVDHPDGQRAVKDSFEAFNNYVNGSRRGCGLSFGEVELVDDPSFLSMEDERNELDKRGKIEVVLQRGKLKVKTKKRKRGERQAQQLEILPMPGETTKTVAMDKGKSHYMKPIFLDLTPDASDQDITDHSEDERSTEWISSEKAGEEITFTFFYTSRRYLEGQNIAPWILNPNTLDTAINVEREDRAADTEPPIRPSSNSVEPQYLDDDIAYLSTNHVGGKRLKIEAGTGQSLRSTFSNGPSYGATPSAINALLDGHDNIPPEDVEPDAEEEEDLYNATPRPPSGSNRARSSTAATSSTAAIARANREAEIRARLEEFRLERELKALDAEDDAEAAGSDDEVEEQSNRKEEGVPLKYE